MRHAKHQGEEGDGKCILLVDDNSNNLRLLSNILSDRGYTVRSVNSGKMALLSATTAPPDLILLDINMPEMNGYEVCQQLKANHQTADLPVIFISALHEVLDMVKAFAVGGVDYISKPFQVPEVIARVENHLTLRRLQRQMQAQNAALQKEVQERIAIEAVLKAEIKERKKAETALKEANKFLLCLTRLDGLTQIANRRHFDEHLQQEWLRLSRERHPLALILCDIDYFKNYNDTYGHQEGDDCLIEIAQTLKNSVKRPADLVARYGGEEFVLILPNTDCEGAMFVAEEIRTQVRKLKITHVNSAVSSYVTLSIGISSVVPSLQINAESLVAAADRALYAAKAQGRDRIVANLLIG